MDEETPPTIPLSTLEEGPSGSDPKEPPVGANISDPAIKDHTLDRSLENTSGDPVMQFVVQNFEQINAMYSTFSSKRKEVNPTSAYNNDDHPVIEPWRSDSEGSPEETIRQAPEETTLQAKPNGPKVPTNLKTYDGMSYPDDHLTIFMETMDVHKLPEPAWCHFFHISLSGDARFWYDNLLPGSINSFHELRDRFRANFLQQRRFQKTQAEILGIRQRSDESLKDYLGRKNQNDWKQKVVAPKAGNEVLMIDEEWSPPHYQKNGLRHNTDISFTSDDPVPDDCSGDDPLVIKAKIRGNIIHRIYVDRGSSAEIMYEHYYIGKGSKKITTDFMIVRAPSPYDVILGRPGMRQLGLIASTIDSLIKFPLKSGVAIIRGDVPHKSRCLQISRKRERECETTVVSEPPGNETEKENVVINTMYANQPVGISTSLPTRIKQELRRILCGNKDIFAWSPSDTTKIPRELADHKLYIHPCTFPVRQKKRVLAKDGNEAVAVEVAKLVEARILKEVYFQRWVATTVMVQKNDVTWQMGIDFTNLNKACPKDSYPLPEIDQKIESLDGFRYKCFLTKDTIKYAWPSKTKKR
ncbi:reverse transcriptase domain-containing protein [Tanacetum coccineum]